MTKEMREESGCNQQKNSVNLGHRTNEGSGSMPVAKEKRDYAKEYQRDKERRKMSEKTVGVKLPIEIFESFDAKIALEPMGEDGKKVTRNGLIRKWIDMYLAGTLE